MSAWGDTIWVRRANPIAARKLMAQSRINLPALLARIDSIGSLMAAGQEKRQDGRRPRYA
jgi:hypothetical protein